jgi:3-oxoadipate enol-lactonase
LVIASTTAGGPEHASYDISEFLKLPIGDAARRALCLQDTRHLAMQDTEPKRFARALGDRIEFETAFRKPSVANGGYGRLLEARRGHDCSNRLDKIPHPTSVIAGRFDMQARPEAQQALAEALPHGDFALLNAGHGVLFAHPEADRIATEAIEARRSKTQAAP